MQIFAMKGEKRTGHRDVGEGDIVKLKSGGPEMTVEKLEYYRGEFRYFCVWFVDGQRMSSTFNPAALAIAHS